jgi:hypothetical protein
MQHRIPRNGEQYQSLGGASTAGNRAAARVLSRLLADGRAELIEGSFPSDIAARVRLLRGGDAFNQGDLDLAKRLTGEFLGGPLPARGRLGIGRRLAEDRQHPGRRHRRGKGQGSGIRPASPGGRERPRPAVPAGSQCREPPRDMPGRAAAAVRDAGCRLRPVRRSRRRPQCFFCHQIRGCLSHLGFESEVIAATAKVIPVKGEAEYIGEQSPPTAAPSRWFLRRARRHLVRIVRPAGRSEDHGDAARPEAAERSAISMLAVFPVEDRGQLLRAPGSAFKARQESLSTCASCRSGRGSSRPCPTASSTPASRTASLRWRTGSWKSCGEPPNSGPTCRVSAPCTCFSPTSSLALPDFRSFQTNRRRRFSACAGHVSSGARGNRYRVPIILRHFDTTLAELPARGPSPATREDPATAPAVEPTSSPVPYKRDS